MAQTMPLKFSVLVRQSCLCECRLSSLAGFMFITFMSDRKLDTAFLACSRPPEGLSNRSLLHRRTPPHPFAHFHFPADECTRLYHLLPFATHAPYQGRIQDSP